MESQFVLARGNIDRDEITRNDPVALGAARRSADARFILCAENAVAVDPEDAGTLLKLGAKRAREWNSREAVYLGRVDGTPFFACDVSEILPDTDVKPAGTPMMRPLQYWAHEWSPDESQLAVMAISIHQWIRKVRFCSVCGNPIAIHPSGWQAQCENGHQHFPRTDPAAIMAIRDAEDRLLLAHNPQWAARRYSVLSGFVEAGESAEAAVRRETFEETRAVVDRVEYFGTQPWPFPRSLMIAYRAWTSTKEEDLRIDGIEMADARFFSREELKAELRRGKLTIPPRESVANALIVDWLGESVEEVMER